MKRVLEIEKNSFPKTPFPERVFFTYHKIYPDCFLIYETEEGILGYIIFRPDGHVDSIAVDPAYRRRGVGKKLAEEVLSQLEGEITLEVRQSNRGAQEFYKSMGFRIAGVVSDCYEDEDGYRMMLGRGLGNTRNGRSTCCL